MNQFINVTSIEDHDRWCGNVVAINFGHVYCIERVKNPKDERSDLAAWLHFVGESRDRLLVKESQLEILRLLEGPGKFSTCSCDHAVDCPENPKNQKHHE